MGYGDIYPQTHLGRFLCVLAMLVGAVLVAVLTVTISSKLSLNAGESRLLQFLQRSSPPLPSPAHPAGFLASRSPWAAAAGSAAGRVVRRSV